ncbi:uncharacterized protein LOC132755214 [Ruditapes philippinarum]|uniref:uncharacterized protein LOC132755214 n=1 Tax=Ruditapes philippinarum TaxID=129788 RepID=UPI00295B3038|nr:uncharacterized protein LOC132755214 [Ruditapes philippinarum]
MLIQCMRYPTYSVLKMQKIYVESSLHSLLKARTSSQMISRTFLINSKSKQWTVQKLHCQNQYSCLQVQKLMNSGHVKPFNLTCYRICCRLYSDMKDDEIVKSWINKIKEDFKKGNKEAVSAESFDEKSDEINSSSGDNMDSDSDIEKLHSSLDEDFDKLEKQGFTTEEIIDLLKKSKSLEDIEEDFEDSDSESDGVNQVKESDKLSADSTESSDVNEDGVNEKSKDEISGSRMVEEDWAVVKMRDDVKIDWSVVEIEDFVNVAEAEDEDDYTWESPVDFVRGKTGVFEIEEIITVLRAANAQDIVTIEVPKNLNFADYMVIVSARSMRHMKAMLADIKWIHKRKKNKKDKYMRIEGEDSEWCAVDLGNVVLHVFMPALRELYDLETLWTVGAKFDPQCTEATADPYVFSADDLPWLKELEQGAFNSDAQNS